MSSDLIASLQEGEEWIARLEQDKIKMVADLQLADLSDVGIAMIQFGISKTNEAIEQVKLEMMLISGEGNGE